MGIPVLLIGKSGSGKSTSLRNCSSEDFGVINVLGKPFPFRSKLKSFKTDSYEVIAKVLAGSQTNSIVIDDAGYLITNHFMKGHSNAGSGNGVFALYNSIGDSFWGLINFVINVLPENKIVYFIMHEDKNDFGDIKPKSIGKMLDEKVCIEGMFTICLRSKKMNDKHIFITQQTDNDVSKTPMGMFEESEIDNDLSIIDKTIREYYEIKNEIKNNDEKVEEK